jgi:hypothetical protein
LTELGIPPVVGAVGYLFIGLLIGGWIGYNYLDYRNDIYVVNKVEVIDIQKVPLKSEERRQASLGVIQDVRYVQPDTLAKLLNYGNLLLETAGTMGAFTFDRVPRPRQVQQTISRRAAEFRERATLEESEQREKQVMEVVEKWWQSRQPPSA